MSAISSFKISIDLIAKLEQAFMLSLATVYVCFTKYWLQ